MERLPVDKSKSITFAAEKVGSGDTTVMASFLETLPPTTRGIYNVYSVAIPKEGVLHTKTTV